MIFFIECFTVKHAKDGETGVGPFYPWMRHYYLWALFRGLRTDAFGMAFNHARPWVYRRFCLFGWTQRFAIQLTIGTPTLLFSKLSLARHYFATVGS